MSIRKIGVIGSFVAGASLALAPLAAAAGEETPDTPPDFSNLLSSEVSFLNSLFQLQATLANVDDGVITAGDPTDDNPLSFSTIDNAALADNSDFAALVYGQNWAEEMSSSGISGSYNLYNGALTQFADANNVLLYAMVTGGDQIQLEDAGDYLFGSASGIEAGLAGDSVWEDASNFYQAGFADLGGYFAPAADIDIDPGV